MKLRCGVYGEESVFSVKIARDVKVSALQKKIFEKKRYRKRFSFDPSELTLYLAQKNGKWLTDGQNAKNLLRGAVDTELQEMLSSWKLNKEELFGPDFQPGQEEVHVLVELPEAASLVKMEKQ